jgi:hypothetical protein
MYADSWRNGLPAMKRALPKVSLALAIACLPSAAFAYIGPGAGLSIVGSIVAFLGAVVVGLAGFVWFPVRRILKRRRAAAAKAAAKSSAGLPTEQR